MEATLNESPEPKYYETLREKLDDVARLEKEGGFFGVRFAFKDDNVLVETHDVVDSVRDLLRTIIAERDLWDTVPLTQEGGTVAK